MLGFAPTSALSCAGRSQTRLLASRSGPAATATRLFQAVRHGSRHSRPGDGSHVCSAKKKKGANKRAMLAEDAPSMRLRLPPTPVDGHTASMVHVSNMMRLCKDMHMPVAHKVHEEVPGEGSHAAMETGAQALRKFVIIVHVHGDFAFRKYLDVCSPSDLMLYRGLLLEVATSADVSKALHASVRQAFLPKFENEDFDTSIADSIVQQASQRFMVITIKHSGSLVTLSGYGFAAKNSVNNAFTDGAQMLLHAHYERLFGPQQGPEKLAALMELLHAHRMSVSFEMVTGCHGHHGQLPAAEYLVATAAHIVEPDTGKPRFLTWYEFLQFCVEQNLPVNDTWLVAGSEWASAARDVLDHLALSGGVTSLAVLQLNNLVQDGAAAGCLHLPGTYPHYQWQGSRLEGFVVAQGQQIVPDTLQALNQLRSRMAPLVLPLERVPPHLHSPYLSTIKATSATGTKKHKQATEEESSAGAEQQQAAGAGSQHAASAAVPALPRAAGVNGAVLKAVPKELGQRVVGAVMDAQVPNPLMRTPDNSLLVSRSALATMSLASTRALLQQLLQLQQSAPTTSTNSNNDGATGQAANGANSGVEVVSPQEVEQVLALMPAGGGGRANKSTESVAGDVPGLRQGLSRVPRAIVGAPSLHNALRYKKKMLLWLTPASSTIKRKASEKQEAQPDGGPHAMDEDGSSPKRVRQEKGATAASRSSSQATHPAGTTAVATANAAAPEAHAAHAAVGGEGAMVCDGGAQSAQNGAQNGGPVSEGGVLEPPGTAANNDGTTAAAAAANGDGAGTHSSGRGSRGAAFVSSDVAAAAEVQGAAGGVGYWMCTFIIRNGLPALRLGLSTYLSYCDSQARRLGLSKKQRGEINMFARTWARWVDERGGPTLVDPLHYLDHAEPFIQAFLADLAQGRMGEGLLGTQRPQGAFQGFLLLVDVPKPKAQAVKAALHAIHFMEASELPPYSKALASQGTVIWFPPGSPPVPKGFTNFLGAAGGSRQLFAYIEPPSPELESSNAPDAKKQKGMRTGKMKALEGFFKGSNDQAGGGKGKGKGKGKQQKQSPEEQAQQAAAAAQQAAAAAAGEQLWQQRVMSPPQERSAEEIAQWVGGGAPLPPADPATIVCFVSIPATGKSVIANQVQPAPGSTPPVQMRVLNSDTLRGKGMPGNRFWQEVATAADTNVGGGSSTAVLADKNLVPSPRDNVERVTGTVKDTEAVAAAVVPTCTGVSSATTQPLLYADLPALPFPLEFIALCMLRVIRRKDHAGNLDAKAPAPLAVVAGFTSFFKHMTQQDLLKFLRRQFHVVAELPIMEAADDQPEKQVPHEVLRTLSAGLCIAMKEGMGDPSPEMKEWERKMRGLLEQPEVEQRLLALQRPLETCCGDLQTIMGTALDRARNPPPEGEEEAEDFEEGNVRWLAVTDFDGGPLRQAARQILPADMQSQMKQELHITLWHGEDPVFGPDLGLQQALLDAEGSEVAFEVTHIDYKPQGMAAAKVQLTTGLEAIQPKLEGKYLHITLVVAPGCQAKDAKLLEPELVAQQQQQQQDGAGEGAGVRRCALPEPLQLAGRVLAVRV